MVLTLIARSPRIVICLASVARELMVYPTRSGRHAFSNLTPATGARTTRLHVRNTAARLLRLSRSLTIFSPCDLMRTRHRRVHRIPPNVRDDRETPLLVG